LYFYPDNINQQSIDRLNYGAEIVWVEVEKDEEAFLSFIDEVLNVLELPEAPEHSPNCQWCNYIGKLNST
jgi:CRISPR/Cas system-associated exonuclease Cas4 (RecB family)